MPAFMDLSGEKYGLLTAKKPIKTRNKTRTRTKWLCECECGATAIVDAWNLTSGHTKSCGCLNSKTTAERNKVIMASHNGSNDRLYSIWHSMKARCHNPNNRAYQRYGGRGITVCHEWLHDYATFRDWAMASGYDKNAAFGECTIDRINNDLGYSPQNCRWITHAEQQRNKRKRKEGETE